MANILGKEIKIMHLARDADNREFKIPVLIKGTDIIYNAPKGTVLICSICKQPLAVSMTPGTYAFNIQDQRIVHIECALFEEIGSLNKSKEVKSNVKRSK